jgi:hypothetical protein
MTGEVKVIVVSDDNEQARRDGVPPGIIAALGPATVLMSNDSLRMYVRATHWENMKQSFLQTMKP